MPMANRLLAYLGHDGLILNYHQPEIEEIGGDFDVTVFCGLRILKSQRLLAAKQ